MNLRLALYLLCVSLSMSAILRAGEIPWTPDTPYNFDRRESASGGDPSPWAETPEYSRIEYRLIYLMEADRAAKRLAQTAKLSEAEHSLLSTTLDDLGEVLIGFYGEAMTFLKIKPNPTLLLMMLYHYNTYVQSANENWPRIIATLRRLDPTITAKAETLAPSNNTKR